MRSTGTRIRAAEICDGLDNDCDNQVDEGACRSGSVQLSDYPLTTVEWSISADNIITMTITSQVTGYVSVGWASPAAHSGGDIVYGSCVGTSCQVTDGYSTSFSAPSIDAQQDVTLVSGSESGGVTTLTFTRPLQTGDTSADVDIVPGQSAMLFWAVNNTSEAMTIHTARGSANITW